MREPSKEMVIFNSQHVHTKCNSYQTNFIPFLIFFDRSILMSHFSVSAKIALLLLLKILKLRIGGSLILILNFVNLS